ncbi:Isochorismatase hydrolase [Basidiobolus meristosporus CBS 931.73]|uniref:Isochorismatase hydrolase n=1 Tax=Basidiobolus meristosporus CBS 931.73 TaxID=1314790 RepID=A0A1Y1Y2V4_9FUNG|nr:Isochorismatase hydrolase [Basidiobolus meristosporus CBS 931.73]|eukprot:ORX92347.1 Isochorismatase hydrolase [Basidiobolus meristosporus CBS 931.73]
MIAYSQVQFTPGYPEFPPNKANKAFYPYVSANELLTNSTQRDIISNVAPQEGDFVVQKRRFNAMFESTLPLLLRANLIDTVVLSGAYTSGVILATLRTCSDMDYQIYVIRENVIDPSYSLSQILLDEFFPQQASVISLETALKALPSK